VCERESVGVICHYCKGTGKETLTVKYNDFEGRKIRNDVKIVISHNAGIVHGDDTASHGMNYYKWFNGTELHLMTEDRKYTCPCWWYQGFDYGKKPDWDWCEWGPFSRCSHFSTKEKCWERFDKEQKIPKGEKP
jgi:hypothetical protein